MRLKDYNKRRKMALGGPTDPVNPGGWYQTRNAGKYGKKIFQSPWSPNVPQTKLGNGLKTLNPLTNPLERVNKLSDVGEGLEQAKKNASSKMRAKKLPPLSRLQKLMNSKYAKGLGAQALHEARKGSVQTEPIGEAAPYEDQEWMGKLQYKAMDLLSGNENQTNQTVPYGDVDKSQYPYANDFFNRMNDNLLPSQRGSGDGSMLMREGINEFTPSPAPQKKVDSPSPSTPRTRASITGGKNIDSASTAGISPTDTVSGSPSMEAVNVPGTPGDMNDVGEFVASNQSGSMDWKGIGETALQFLPDAINLATGLFSKDKTPAPTRVDKSAISNMPRKFNANPMLRSNAKSFRAILSDPNATTNQKIAAMAMKQNADQKVYAQKINQENRMASDRARIEANLDSQQARYDSQARGDKMASDANRGIGGNFARAALSGMSNKALQIIRQNNLKDADQATIRAVLAGVDPNIAQEILNSMK